MKNYVLGFYFSEKLDKVILIKKTHPPFQAGKLNGVGGGIEVGESPREAMIREFKEEANVEYKDWKFLKTFESGGSTIYIYYGIGDISKCKPLTEEELWYVTISSIKNIKNLLDGVELKIDDCLRKIYSDQKSSYSYKSIQRRLFDERNIEPK